MPDTRNNNTGNARDALKQMEEDAEAHKHVGESLARLGEAERKLAQATRDVGLDDEANEEEGQAARHFDEASEELTQTTKIREEEQKLLNRPHQ